MIALVNHLLRISLSLPGEALAKEECGSWRKISFLQTSPIWVVFGGLHLGIWELEKLVVGVCVAPTAIVDAQLHTILAFLVTLEKTLVAELLQKDTVLGFKCVQGESPQQTLQLYNGSYIKRSGGLSVCFPK